MDKRNRRKKKMDAMLQLLAVLCLAGLLTGCAVLSGEGTQSSPASENTASETETAVESRSMTDGPQGAGQETEPETALPQPETEPQAAVPNPETDTAPSIEPESPTTPANTADMLPILLENPGVGYYLAEEPETVQEHTLQQEQIYKKANAITDEEGWFAANQLEIPFYIMPGSFAEGKPLPEQIPDSFEGFPLTQAWFDDSFIYCVYGEVYYEGYLLKLYEKNTCAPVMSLDFSAFCTREYGDGIYQWVRWARVDGQTLYVSLSHNTYSENAPNHAYIAALDLTYMHILWKTEPLVSNARNFEIIGNELVCGYGFTAEDDFLYQIDRATGRILEQIPVASQADYIIRKDDRLFVRTYDTNYVFQITEVAG